MGQVGSQIALHLPRILRYCSHNFLQFSASVNAIILLSLVVPLLIVAVSAGAGYNYYDIRQIL